MNIYFIAFGCKVSQYETECMKENFIKEGFAVSSDEENADVFIINTCTVTAVSDKKCRQTLRRIRKNHPGSVIAVTGCFPQAFPDKISDIKEADIITGTKNRSEITELVKKALNEKKQLVEIEPFMNHEAMEILSCSSFTGKTRAFVKIQDGCNQFCSYCIIPYARGRNRSKPLDELKSEIRTLAENGHREIVLVGINLAFYGSEYGLTLADAVEACCSIKGVERVRLSSLEPEKITDDELVRFSQCSQFCPHFHLSLQSGCDRTLKAMNRRYDSSEYYDLVCRIRKIFPDCSLTTDVMTGFPGETDEDFRQSYEFVRKTAFSQIHVFPYSRRSGTPADKFPDQIPDSVKHQRAAEMSELGRELHRNFLKSHIGRTVPVLFEKETSPEFHQGHTPDYTYVKIPAAPDDKSFRKSVLNVRITDCDSDCCYGVIADR